MSFNKNLFNTWHDDNLVNLDDTKDTQEMINYLESSPDTPRSNDNLSFLFESPNSKIITSQASSQEDVNKYSQEEKLTENLCQRPIQEHSEEFEEEHIADNSSSLLKNSKKISKGGKPFTNSAQENLSSLSIPLLEKKIFNEDFSMPFLGYLINSRRMIKHYSRKLNQSFKNNWEKYLRALQLKRKLQITLNRRQKDDYIKSNEVVKFFIKHPRWASLYFLLTKKYREEKYKTKNFTFSHKEIKVNDLKKFIELFAFRFNKDMRAYERDAKRYCLSIGIDYDGYLSLNNQNKGLSMGDLVFHALLGKSAKNDEIIKVGQYKIFKEE